MQIQPLSSDENSNMTEKFAQFALNEQLLYILLVLHRLCMIWYTSNCAFFGFQT